jgi:hypothetical protein
MSGSTLQIGYASEDAELPADRLLRRIAGWWAIVYAAEAIVNAALQLALHKRWVAMPANSAWALGGRWGEIVMGVRTVMMCMLLIGGVLLLRRSGTGVLILRAALAGAIVLAILNFAVLEYPSMAISVSRSMPVLAASFALPVLQSVSAPVLLLLVTLPPLARRMV